MFKLNLKIALRNLWKNKTSSFINVVGLAIGLAACLMLLLYVDHEWNFDRQSKNSNHIYTVMNNFKNEKGQITTTWQASATALTTAIKEEIPEVNFISRSNYNDIGFITYRNKSIKKLFRVAEPDIFNIYDIKFIEGNSENALNDINSIVLTESTAKLLFNKTDVLDKIVRLDNKTDFKVSAVIRDLPSNSSFTPDFILPWKYYPIFRNSSKKENWTDFSYITLLTVKPTADINLVNKKINNLVSRNVKNADQSYFLYPLNSLYLRGNFKNGKSIGGNIENIWLYTALALGILIIACINFMNLATAKSEKRAKEVAIKKTIGANRSSLIIQFLTESLILTLIAVLFAFILAELMLPFLNNLLGISLNIIYLNFYSWLGILGIALFTGIIAGCYPAFYLSSFNPTQALKKFSTNKLLDFNLRQILVVMQFGFSILLIIATLIIYEQIQYAKNKSLGFDKDVLIQMPQQGLLSEKYDLLKDKLIKSDAVTSVTQTSVGLSHYGSMFSDVSWPGMAQRENKIFFNRIATSYDFIKTSGIKLIEGRDFSAKHASDTNGVLISKSALKIMALKNPLEKNIKIFKSNYHIIGVFEDFVWDSPYKTNDPMLIYFKKEYLSYITMRLNTNYKLSDNIKQIEKITKQLNPTYPVEISFLNSIYEQKFKSQQVLGKLSNLFAGLAIFISCMGLFGLVTYSAEQRTKEFGVRKILGASVVSIMQLLIVSFVKMITVAIVIAIPLSYYLMNNWLATFEFHVSFKWWIIPLSIIIIFSIAIITVIFQGYKSARANPVDVLKYE